jgi:hypothetical protein
VPAVVLDVRRLEVPMSPLAERLITVAVTAAVTSGLSSLGYTGIVNTAEASKSAQDQCCPIARACVERIAP